MSINEEFGWISDRTYLQRLPPGSDDTYLQNQMDFLASEAIKSKIDISFLGKGRTLAIVFKNTQDRPYYMKEVVSKNYCGTWNNLPPPWADWRKLPFIWKDNEL